MRELFNFPFTAMGSDCSLHLYGDNQPQAEEIAQAAVNEIARIERRYSRYRSDSVITEINNVARCGGSISVDEETAKLIDFAFACYQRSGGLFDITSGILRKAWDFKSRQLPETKDIDGLLPLVGLSKVSWQRPHLKFAVEGMELDFGGIGKEYAADQAVAVCRTLGIRYGLVELGGDTAIIGSHPDKRPWKIGIRHPRDPASIIASLSIHDGALASSGDYERYMIIDGIRYCHILNPLTGWPCRSLAAVSVVADQCLLAGAVATIAMLKGCEASHWLSEIGLRYICIDEDGLMESNCSTKEFDQNPGRAPI